MAGKLVYLGDPYNLEIQYFTDLSTATSIQIRVQNPNGVVSYVNGTQYQGTKIIYGMSAAENNLVGDWVFQGAANFGSGLVHGQADVVSVSARGTARFNAG